MDKSDSRRLSVSLVDVHADRLDEFRTLATHVEAILIRKDYGRMEVIRDEALPLRFYAVRFWADAAAAERCHGDREVQALTAKLYQLSRVMHIVNGVRPAAALRLQLDDRRAHADADRRAGFDRRVRDVGRPEGDRRKGDRRLGPRRQRDSAGDVDLVGAALETGDGVVVTGCNIENATYGLTICAERVAMFKALSDGHRVFSRIAIVADTESPTPPCGACRQILWEFGGNLEIELANLEESKGKHQLKNLLPLPFDARLL